MTNTKKTRAQSTTTRAQKSKASKAKSTAARSQKKATAPRQTKKATTEPQMLKFVKNDPWLHPFEEAINGRHLHVLDKMAELTDKGQRRLEDFATGYLYFGLHYEDDRWVFREWAPKASEMYLIGDFSDWREKQEFRLKCLSRATGVWEVKIPTHKLQHGQHYKLSIHWRDAETQTPCQGERIPAWATRVVQDEQTKIFSAQVWKPETAYQWRVKRFRPQTSPLFIYEAHIGMAQDKEGVGTYNEFRQLVLPRIVRAGYNCIQLMAIQEHPYYGSFGYHVSNFFAASSRYGTPEELKALIDACHEQGIAVIMDLVHSHSVKNENEGLANFCGNPSQYFYEGQRRVHPAWDSLCFDYGKNEVLHFLLSNCKYWLEEYHFDGYRFDGVTSMLYYSHGLGEVFTTYQDYYNGHQDDNAICYLTLANILVHAVNSRAITIAEEVSGMPGLACPFKDGGYGFDYRLAMNIPDYWIRLIKEQKDQDWRPSNMLWELKNRRADEKTISYCESHDQALVGDKTIIFRLVDADMYWHFSKADANYRTHRGLALHKMIRLLTAGTMNGGYLNFMGNEFGHPEWIDFPREGNGWSYKYARRQWHLVDDHDLCYHQLADFDRKMLRTIARQTDMRKTPVQEVVTHDGDQVLAFQRAGLIFVFNFSPFRSYMDYGIKVKPGAYDVVLDTDDPRYGGNGLNDDTLRHYTTADPSLKREGKAWLKLYLPARVALVLTRVEED